METFNGKVALVTGASSGIGKATAVAFGKAGAMVVVAARRELEGTAVVDAIKAGGGEAIFVKTDVTREAEVAALLARISGEYGRLDFAFNNAGSGKAARLVDYTEQDWDAEIAINLKSVWLSLKYELPLMALSGGGGIVNMSSQGGLLGIANYGVYGAAKGGVIALSRAAAAEGAADKIRVNSIAPGAVKTELWDNAPAGMLEQVASGIPCSVRVTPMRSPRPSCFSALQRPVLSRARISPSMAVSRPFNRVSRRTNDSEDSA